MKASSPLLLALPLLVLASGCHLINPRPKQIGIAMKIADFGRDLELLEVEPEKVTLQVLEPGQPPLNVSKKGEVKRLYGQLGLATPLARPTDPTGTRFIFTDRKIGRVVAERTYDLDADHTSGRRMLREELRYVREQHATKLPTK